MPDIRLIQQRWLDLPAHALAEAVVGDRQHDGAEEPAADQPTSLKQLLKAFSFAALTPAEREVKVMARLITSKTGNFSMLVGKVVRKKPATNDKVISFHA